MTAHFYPVLADLEDGSEDWRCALALDEHPQVKCWVRNLDVDRVNGFWLPTSSDRFYPDFVCELLDERVFVAEYKGNHLRAAPKEIEKGQVGRVWADRSAGRAVFAVLYKGEHGQGLCVADRRCPCAARCRHCNDRPGLSRVVPRPPPEPRLSAS